jgi:hypothetical protein
MNYLDLLFNPKRFFANELIHANRLAILLAGWCLGIASVMDQIDRRILQQEVNTNEGHFGTIESVVSSWPVYWATVIAGGFVAAALLWFAGGWWYTKRLEWSGAQAPNVDRARRVYVYQGFVYALPFVVVTVIQTALFASYKEAWAAGDLVSGFTIVVFAFVSCWTSFVGANTSFALARSRAIVWFAAAPAAFYLLVIGIVGYVSGAAS